MKIKSSCTVASSKKDVANTDFNSVLLSRVYIKIQCNVSCFIFLCVVVVVLFFFLLLSSFYFILFQITVKAVFATNLVSNQLTRYDHLCENPSEL